MEKFLLDAARVAPSPRQKRWFDIGFYAFVHFGVNTFTDREWGDGTEAESLFNPTDLDCGQWVEAIQAAGMKGLILTAKHHDGFCLWPSKYTEHSVKNSPFQGDVVKLAAEACARSSESFRKSSLRDKRKLNFASIHLSLRLLMPEKRNNDFINLSIQKETRKSLIIRSLTHLKILGNSREVIYFRMLFKLIQKIHRSAYIAKSAYCNFIAGLNLVYGCPDVNNFVHKIFSCHLCFIVLHCNIEKFGTQLFFKQKNAFA